VALQVFNVVGERTEELGVFAEAYEKEFVLWIGGFNKLKGGLLGLAQFVGHAAAEI